ncbi:MAG TPA: SSI family serine proteinase inhibitor [Blastococcus sp.]
MPPAARTLAAGPRTETGGLLALASSVLLAGCGSTAVGQPAQDQLQVTVDAGDGTESETYRLDCDPPSGSHPDPEAACTHLAATDDPFAPLPGDVACTQQFGGPQTANVLGRWAGEEVDVVLARTDGCRIAQWDALGPLLPGPVG